MHLSIINLCVNSNTDNSHIKFWHIYCLLHPSVVSYIISSFMKYFYSYIHWMNLFICSNVVATLLAKSSEKCEWKSIFTFPWLIFSLWYLLRYSHVFLSIERVWLKQTPLTEFTCQVMPLMLHHNHVLSSHHSCLPKNIHF